MTRMRTYLGLASSTSEVLSRASTTIERAWVISTTSARAPLCRNRATDQPSAVSKFQRAQIRRYAGVLPIYPPAD
jgi:hypothetical protein